MQIPKLLPTKWTGEKHRQTWADPWMPKQTELSKSELEAWITINLKIFLYLTFCLKLFYFCLYSY